MMEEESNKSVILSINDISEDNEYVIVRIKEVVNNEIVENLEKGIKDKYGDIIQFVPYDDCEQ